MCLFEVVSDNLLLLGHGVPGHTLKPVGEALVQLGALCLGDRVVRRIADQQVPEAKGVLARQCGALRPDR